ncbi:MAE_28990/MAE_18760 family HEPN-like nuclease [Ruegeria lacuscaerulensis]|uniref:MAE_28990/MAE_18760 family HEPN-like nuclease n=1 Tax=Ruegeria lacuscaerulensis TaxID=55218 RepID=UPI001479CC14|nr:MAE_28990/MAE_18760 family HEPN-like nuclease [Ruegeria lacuscaerulensis]
MRSAAEVHAELEADRESRETEIRLIEQVHDSTDDEDDQIRYRRILVLMTYAHLEGFCRFSLLTYASAINSMRLSCASVSPAIAAAGLSNVFGALRDAQRKHDAFRKTLPDDSALHLSAREQKFIVDYEKISQLVVEIPDKVIDTKSNVDTAILKKLLFQLGLEFEDVENHRAILNRLVGTRNAIAHGDRLAQPGKKEVADFLNAARTIMNFIQEQVFYAMQNNLFLRSASDPDLSHTQH